MRLGWPEILLILAIVVIVFGVGKLPQVGAQLGKGIRQFRKSLKGDDDAEVAKSTGKPSDSKTGDTDSN